MEGGREAADERRALAAARGRVGVDAIGAHAVEDHVIEGQPDRLGADPEGAKALDPGGDGGRDQVEPLEQRRVRGHAADLRGYGDPAFPHRLDLLLGQRAGRLRVDDAGREVRDLVGEHAPPGPAPGAAGGPARLRGQPHQRFRARAVLLRPASLERVAVEDDLDGLVPHLAQVVGVGVGRAEAAVHQRGELLVIRPILEARAVGVVASQEVLVVGVEDQRPHQPPPARRPASASWSTGASSAIRSR
jgi:hypothetical protein